MKARQTQRRKGTMGMTREQEAQERARDLREKVAAREHYARVLADEDLRDQLAKVSTEALQVELRRRDRR